MRLYEQTGFFWFVQDQLWQVLILANQIIVNKTITRAAVMPVLLPDFNTDQY